MPTAPVIDLCEVSRRAPPATGLHRLTRTKPGAIAVSLTFFLIGTLGSLLIPLTGLLANYLGVISHAFMRWWFDVCVGSWYVFVTSTFEFVFGIKTRIFGYRGHFKKRCVFIMNHVSHLDWMYFWAVASRRGDISKWRVVTKDNIRNLPILGPCMQCACLLFIKRSWEKDEAEFRDKLNYHNSLPSCPCQLLLFPEGGDLTYKSRAKSNTFADQNNLPRYHYCLHPRTKGFTYIVNKMREEGLDAIYDVTICFPDTLPKTEVDFINGTMPKHIDFHIKSYEDSEIPKDTEKLSEWCQERWREKEALLHDYHSNNGTFKDVQSTPENGAISTKSSANNLTASNRIRYLLLMLSINLVPAILLYFYWQFMLVFYCCSLVFTVWLCKYSGGFDGLILWMHRKTIQEYLTRNTIKTKQLLFVAAEQ